MFENPSVAQLAKIAKEMGLDLSTEYLEKVTGIVAPLTQAYQDLENLPDVLPNQPDRTPTGTRPNPADNPLNAWYMRTEIKGAASGLLEGRTVAIKDSICVAGVPMMFGSKLMEGFVPDMDATVVARILEAGGTITGKTVCENYCVSGGSHTSAMGPVINPHKPGHSAGGSSSGSAAAVGAGEVDMALGGDQAGSIRIPSAFCGTYGMKATHGLAPYTGEMALESSLDHTGPITNNVRDNATLLQVIAGEDGLDTRQRNVQVKDYASLIGKDISGLKIGLVAEGFGHFNSDPVVDASVRNAAAKLQDLGAEVEEISIPMHKHGLGIWASIAHEGGYWTMITNGMGTGHQAPVASSFPHYGSEWKRRPNDMSDPLKIVALFGAYATQHYDGQHFAKAQRARHDLIAAYDKIFETYDLVIMPTVPMTATPIPEDMGDLENVTRRSWEMTANTCVFNASGHPAMSVPSGMVNGLPIGMMLVAGYWQEPVIYQVAAAFEAAQDWKALA